MEKFEEIISNIDSPDFRMDIEAAFSIGNFVGALLLNSDENIRDLGRRVVIRVLANWHKVNNDCKDIWIDLMLRSGFYPYIQKEGLIDNLPFFSAIEQESYSSDNQNLYYHKKQKQLYELIVEEKKNLLVSAPTSFGKSFLIEEIVASKKYKNILIIQPTLALLAETRRNLQKYDDYYNIVVRTTQKAKEEGANLFLLTAERVLEYEGLPNIDFFVLDEFYKISNAFSDERRDVLNVAVFKILNTFNPQLYFIGPYIEQVSQEFLEKYNASFLNIKYSLVDVDTYLIEADSSLKQVGCSVYHKVITALRRLDGEGQTIFYCSSPDMTFRVAKIIYDYIHDKTEPISLPLAEWIKRNISQNWEFVNFINWGIGVHNAALPKHITSSIISYFNKRKLKFLVCTSTIIEGVNTSAKNIVIVNPKKSKKSLTIFDYKNIRGRAGRFMQHYIGNLYSFKEEPKEDIEAVDIPFVDQSEPFSTDIMLQLPDEMIKNKTSEDYLFIQSLPIFNRLVYKKNGLPVRAQHMLYLKLKEELQQARYKQFAYWDNVLYPTKNELKYVLDRCWEFFGMNGLDHAIYNSGHLVDCIALYRGWNTFHRLQLQLQWKSSEDKAIVNAFNVINHWFQYKVPKWLSVFNEIQKLIAQELGMEEANYVAFASALEQEFLLEQPSLLLEYGIPASAIDKIQHMFPSDLRDDSIMNWLKTNSQQVLSNDALLDYEKEKINELISD